MTEAQFKTELATKYCPFHAQPLPLKSAEVVMYNHDAGIKISGKKSLQWVYVVCPDKNCKQQYSHRYLEIKDK